MSDDQIPPAAHDPATHDPVTHDPVAHDPVTYDSVTYDAGRPRGWWALAAVALVLVVGGAVAARMAFSSLPPGTTLAGVTVRTPAEAAAVADDVAARLIDLPVRLRTVAGDTTVRAGRLGATLETGTVRAAAVDATGFDGWVERFTGGGAVELPLDVAVSGIDLDDVVEAVSREPVDGDLRITAAGIEVVDPVRGVTVSEQQVRDAVTPALADLARTPAEAWPDPLLVELEGTESDPVVGEAAVEAALSEVERLTAEPVELTASVVPEDGQTVDGLGVPAREEVALQLTPADLRQLIGTEVDPDAIQRERLRVVADVEDAPDDVIEFVEAAAAPPELDVRVEDRSPPPTKVPDPTPGPGGPAAQDRYADITGVTGRLVAEVAGPGLEPDLLATTEAVLAAADAGRATAAVDGTLVEDPDPALLGITAPVSTYTTFFTPGQARSTNIRRIAEVVDGALIPPGGNYDVNHAVGERTAADGFVPAGAILEGEFIDDVGGGVSQFATTFFNAMWFAGVDLITHTPHSYWFDRYPAGREATIDYPGVDLELNNNTPYWILVDTHTTEDSVTVTFWSTPYFVVEQSIGPRQPVEGGDFRIAIERVATAPPIPELELEGIVDDDRFAHTYGTPPED